MIESFTIKNPTLLKIANDLAYKLNVEFNRKTIYITNPENSEANSNVLKLLLDFGFIQYLWGNETNNISDLDRILIDPDHRNDNRIYAIALLNHIKGNVVLIDIQENEVDFPDFINNLLTDPSYATHTDQYGRLWKPSFTKTINDDIEFGYFFINNRWVLVELEDFIELKLRDI